MAIKTERFEMRLDETILSRVDDWRAKEDDIPSRAEAMRRLLELGLTRIVSETVKFTDGEKLLALMIRDLYKHLDVNGEIDADFIADVIWGGHYWAPKWVLPGLYHDHEDDAGDVHFVVEALNMWSFLEYAYKKLSKKDKGRVKKEARRFGDNVKFPGFDGNYESSFGCIADFLIDKMDRFQEFKGRDLNSHAPMRAIYSRMMIEFQPMRSKLMGIDLDAGQVIRILNAGAASE